MPHCTSLSASLSTAPLYTLILPPLNYTTGGGGILSPPPLSSSLLSSLSLFSSACLCLPLFSPLSCLLHASLSLSSLLEEKEEDFQPRGAYEEIM